MFKCDGIESRSSTLGKLSANNQIISALQETVCIFAVVDMTASYAMETHSADFGGLLLICF
jgi:hypothetical protein